MAPLRLYNNSSAFVPKSECIYIFGDNSSHDKPDPWSAALRVVNLIAMATDGEDDYSVARHYTVRLAVSPQDDDVVKRMLTAQTASVEGGSGSQTELDVAGISASFSTVMLAIRILVDGGDDDSSLSERLFSVPREQWHPNPVPPGRSAVGTSGPDGGYVLMHDMPKPVLEEYAVGCVCMRALPGSDEKDNQIGGDTKVCEIDCLYVDPEEDDSLAYVLVEMMAEHARVGGYRTLKTAPNMEIGRAKRLFESAEVASVVPMDVSASTVEADDETTGQMTKVWKLDLNSWSGPAGRLVTR